MLSRTATSRFRFAGDSPPTGTFEIPEVYSVMVEPAVPIGGVVSDESGHPVAGTRVFPFFDVKKGELESRTVPPGFPC